MFRNLTSFIIFGFITLAVVTTVQAGIFSSARERMVEKQLKDRDITDKKVLKAMQEVPREKFVPKALMLTAYADRPLPIGHNQTISQPYIVALMTQLLKVKPTDRVLEVGTGSGYQAAVLSKLAKEVYTIEIVKPLAEESKERLKKLGYNNVHVKWGDGYEGWPEAAPFDGIMVTAAADFVPPALKKQLAEGGRIVIPLGDYRTNQLLTVITKEKGKLKTEYVSGVRFVPMTGIIQDEKVKKRDNRPE